MTLAIISYFCQRFRCFLSGSSPNRGKTQDSYPGVVNMPKVDSLKFYLNLLHLDLLEYRVTTSDGYVLNLQRVVRSSDSDEERASKVPILLVHGLMQSSASFMTSGIKSLGYLLLENEYDVWLGNNRCGFHPQHTEFSSGDPEMWTWDIREMATKDLPCMVDHVLRFSCYKKLALCCHSQGTTQSFIALSKYYVGDTLLNDKVGIFIALAPAVFAGPLLEKKRFIRFINFLSPTWYNIFFGVNSFMPIMMKVRGLIYDYKIFGFLSYAMFSFLFDWNDNLWNRSLIAYHFLFSPVYVSSQLMKWWLNRDGFFNCKSVLNDEEQWFSSTSPAIMMVVAGQDRLVDGVKLFQHFQDQEVEAKAVRLEWIESYSHLDVLWADDVIDRIGQPILEFLSVHKHSCK